MRKLSLFNRSASDASEIPDFGSAAIQKVQGGAGDVFAVKDGDLYAWTYRGDPQYRLRPAGTQPPELSETVAQRFPSRLLAARYEVVDLVGRKEELSHLKDWASNLTGPAVKVIHAMGGQGKTRIAARIARDMGQAGWVVVEAHHRQAPLLGSATTAAETAQSRDGAGLLVLVDYADRWPTPDLLALLDAHISLPGPVRVLLVARGLQGWWRSVEDALLDAGIDQVDEYKLPPLAKGLAGEGLNAHLAFSAAVAAFSPYLGLAEPSSVSVPEYVSTLGSDHALSLYMAALVATDATARGSEPPSSPAALSTYLLNRERKGWQQLADSGKITCTLQQIGHATVVAALTQALPYPEGIRAVQVAGLAINDLEADQLLRDHMVAYPTTRPGMVLEALAPDRLIEDYIALTVPGSEVESDFPDPWAVSAVSRLLAPTPTSPHDSPPPTPPYLRPAVTALVEAASRWPHLLTQALRPLLDRNPGLVLAGGGATLARLATLADSDTELLNLIAEQLPPGVDLEFDEAAVVVAERRVAVASNTSMNSADLAKLQLALGYRYYNFGRGQDALAPTRDAIEIYRGLAHPRTGNTAYLPHLAGSLNNLGTLLLRLGRHQDALAPTQQAADTFRILADLATGDVSAHSRDLAMSLNNLGTLLAGLGRHQDALAPTQEATDTFRILADREIGDPVAHLPHLAGSLTNLGTLLAGLGRHQDALAPTKEAADTFRSLADPVTGDPAAHSRDLAMSLNNLGTLLAGLGRHHDALAPCQDAVDTFRILADPETGNPTAYLPSLAASLNNFGNSLAGLGRHQDALAPTEDAVRIRRILADARTGDPTAHLPDLAGSLNNLGIRLAALGRHQDALAATEEAAHSHRVLADPETGSPAYLPNFAGSLNNLGIRLAALGRHQDALAPTQEAANIYRVLTDPETGNPACLPDLAASLTSLGIRLAELGRYQDALVPTQEAADTYRELTGAETGNPAYLPNLARSLNSLGVRLAELDRHQDALVATQEAADTYRVLTDPETGNPAYLSDLAGSLNNLGNRLAELGRHEDALVPTKEAAGTYRVLADSATGSPAYLPDLAGSLNNLGNRLAEVGRYEDALVSTQEAVNIRRDLSRSGTGDPVAHLDRLATSLWTVAQICDLSRREAETGISAVHESIRIYESLAAAGVIASQQRLRLLRATRDSLLILHEESR